MNTAGNIILKKGKSYSIERFHPWIFSGAIQRIEGAVTDGCWVSVLDNKGVQLGFGHYQQGSIAVRMLSFGPQTPADNFWTARISEALRLRNLVNLPNDTTNCFRLVHGEGDGLPGLIIDYYDGVVVMQAHSIGMHLDRANIAAAIDHVFNGQLKAVYYKSNSTLPSRVQMSESAGYLKGMGGVPHIVTENSCKFYVDWEEGQKTGFFLDQRENRALLGKYTRGKRVLNTFCYTGGFSIYAIDSNATVVHSVDASEKAIAVARKNIELNQFDEHVHKCYASDTFDYLKDHKDQYDVIVLDPPAFAKHRDARHQAVKGYQRLNVDAMKAIRSDGILFTFSCSQVVDRKLFHDTVVSAAINAGRKVRILHQLSQSADHPTSAFHPEGEYLKGLVLHVA